ncbi:hypothetical protein V6N11_064010 [Hibiscus sabdariffa]|uniref:Uncharacterized protein n=1 Tax=Hibiscus sabdariffa TaxID=183260 RepID=A0ABR2PMC6_9ROSI
MSKSKWRHQEKYSLTDMANSRIHRFISEVAPPRFATVMRQRTWTMLETICEEDRDGSYTVDTSIPAAGGGGGSSSSATTVTAHSTYFIPELQELEIFIIDSNVQLCN